MAQNPFQDPNFLRRQREKREAQKKAAAAASQATQSALTAPTAATATTTASAATVAPPLTTAQARQLAIAAHIQKLLGKGSATADD